MQRGKHTMDDPDKSTSLLQAPPDSREHKLQFPEELLVEREASAALSARRAFACRVVTAGFGILFIILFCFKAVTESADQRRSFSSSCMHELGGGPTGARGSLLHFDPRCTEELKEYFDQAYYEEVRRVSDQAIAYFKQQVARHQQQEALGGVAPGSSRGTVIFDIDETALSNMDGFFGPSSWARLLGGSSSDRCVRPHLEYANLEPLRLQLIGQTGQLAPMQPARRPLCSAPPLRPTLDLYNYLYDNNFTVVFLTGRSEDARAETEANLADAGYGRKCGAAPIGVGAGAAAGSVDAARRNSRSHRRRSLWYSDSPRDWSSGSTTAATQTVTDSVGGSAAGGAASSSETGGFAVNGVDAAAASTWAAAAAAVAATSSETSNPAAASASSQSQSHSSLPFAGLFAPPSAPPQRCYAELLMRVIGDERLASVFKAEARARLVAGGHVLVGNIGDQFSDLVGQASATANFKLPNPVYTLL